jgi:hypothetical protein
MCSFQRAAALGGLCLLAVPHLAAAHAVAGARVFVPTLTMDDPGVADEASLPTISWQRSGADGGPGPVYTYGLGAEYDKTITPNLGVAINDGGTIVQTLHGSTETGLQNLFVTLKYQAYVNAEHEFIASFGVQREFGGTGDEAAGADRYGSTTPVVYFGKGLGDLPIGPLRAFGITGEFSYTFADTALKYADPANPGAGFNAGNPNQYNGAISVQYNLSYLQGQVKDYGFGDFINRLVPLVELTWSSQTTSPGNSDPQFLIAPGVVYMADTWDFGIEALIPGNKATGTNVGVIAQFHLFFDDLFPNSIGKPLFE